MRIAIIGQQEFGKAVLEAFLARGDEVAGVFCMPEKAGAKVDALREAAQSRGLPEFQFSSLRSSYAEQAPHPVARRHARCERNNRTQVKCRIRGENRRIAV